MSHRLHIDFETYSELDLPDVGAFRYAEHPSTEVLMLAFALDDMPPDVWVPAWQPEPPRGLVLALENPELTIHAFNAQFEQQIMRHKLPQLYNLIHSKRWRCTATEAYALSFTGSLDDVVTQIGLPMKKDPKGVKLIQRFCKPQPRNHKVRRWTNANDPMGFAELVSYCRRDVEVERELYRWIRPRWNMTPVCMEMYFADAQINERGLPIDDYLVEGAIDLRDRAFARAEQEMSIITGLRNPNSVQQLLRWCQSRGVAFNNLQAPTVDRWLKRDGGDPIVRRALELRRLRGLSSLAKWDALDRALCDDGRLRGVLRFLGASRTGRWAGRIFQPQNLPRGFSHSKAPIEEIAQAITERDERSLDALTKVHSLRALSAAVRMAVCSEGDSLAVCDLSSIESRVLGWLAGCDRITDTFAKGLDTYKDFATVIFGCRYDEVTKEQRNYSKPPTLGCGYRLGGKGLVAYADGMGVTMTEQDADRIVKQYRETYPEVPKLWYSLERAFIGAVKNEGKVFHAGAAFAPVWFDGEFVWCMLPSGRKLSYYKPEIHEGMYTKEQFTFMGQDSRTKQWGRQFVHGGFLTENLVQAIARDVLVFGLMRALGAGLDVVLHVHDEIVVDVPKGGDAEKVLETLRDCMKRPMPWASDLLLDAAGFLTYHYCKD